MGDVLSPEEIQYEEAHASDNQQTLVRVLVAVFMAVAWTAVVLRIIARRRARAPLGWDDYTAFMGLAITTASSAFALVMVQYGLGRHVIYVANKEDFITAVLTCEVLYVASLPFLKSSLLFLYVRIFPSPRLRHAALSVGVFVVAYSVVLAVCIVLQCVPIASFWTDEPAHCIDFAIVLVVCSVCNILTDILIVALPVPFVWRLRTSRAKRVQILATFFLGGLVTVISIVRTVLVSRPSAADKSWSDVGSTIISMVEINVGVLCTCLPTMRPLLRRPGQTRSSAPYSSQNTRPPQSKPSGRDREDKSWIALDEVEEGSPRRPDSDDGDESSGPDVSPIEAQPEAATTTPIASPPRPPPHARNQSQPWIMVETSIEIGNEHIPVQPPSIRSPTPNRR